MDNSKQAFPSQEDVSQYDGVSIHEPGMTLREHYAGLAMWGLLTNLGNSNFIKTLCENSQDNNQDPQELIAEMAVGHAESLISELQKE